MQMALVRTYHPRRGRLSGRHLDALDRLLPVYGIAVDEPTAFTADRPLVLEIGSGMGEATLAMAAADPGRIHLAAEIHTPGVANLLATVEERGLTNVRVAFGDALDLLRDRIAPAGLDAVHVFFPDPWPKSRHHKRRLIQPAHLALIRSRLRPGGTLWCATDWADYAAAMHAAVAADPVLVGGYAPRPDARPVTKFEQRGIAAGRTVYDLVWHRR
jgi:tRNA (guanine-N7-)-methyltransferase